MTETKKLAVGEKMPDFTYKTPFAENQNLIDTVKKASKTAIVFLRYFGCTLCQLDMHELAKNYADITSNGGQVLVVLQSKPEGIASQITKDTFPFDIICDPEASLYKRFAIEPATSKLKMASLGTISKINKAKKAGFTHGEYEGDELQLPAAFVLTNDCTITYAHYGKNVSDLPTPSELKELLA